MAYADQIAKETAVVSSVNNSRVAILNILQQSYSHNMITDNKVTQRTN